MLRDQGERSTEDDDQGADHEVPLVPFDLHDSPPRDQFGVGEGPHHGHHHQEQGQEEEAPLGVGLLLMTGVRVSVSHWSLSLSTR